MALAGYLFTVVARAVQTELLRLRADRPALTGTVLRRASTNFQMEMAQRVAARLEQSQLHARRRSRRSARAGPLSFSRVSTPWRMPSGNERSGSERNERSRSERTVRFVQARLPASG